MLIDCGKASKKTLGLPFQLFFELGVPPFNRNNVCTGVGGC